MTGPAALRLVVVDDQAITRLGLRYALDRDGLRVVAEAADGESALAVVARCRPDVVVMDVRMPGRDGISATRALTAEPGAPRVLVLTTFGLDEYLTGALRAGATGFVLKDAPPATLRAAVRAVASGAVFVDPAMAGRLAAALPAHPAPAPGLDRLTDRERDVLALVGAGRSNAEIAAALVVEESTVKTHVHRILTKLGLRNRVQAALLAQAAGIVPR